MVYFNIRNVLITCFSSLLLFHFFGCASKLKSTKGLKKISYTFEPHVNGKSLNVTLEFLGSLSSETKIMYSDQWAGQKFHQDISNFKVLNNKAVLLDTKERNVKLITHKASEKLRITYELTQNTPLSGQAFRAIINQDYFHFIGSAALVTPEVLTEADELENYEVTMDFKGFGPNTKIANSFYVNKMRHTFTASVAELLHAIYVGGDFRIQKILIKNKPLYVAIRGSFTFKDEDLIQSVEKIVSYQRDFFKDYDFKQFLITIIPNGAECCSRGGTGLTRSFATFISKDTSLKNDLVELLSHELFHTWNGDRIRRQQPEELLYWFTEGFTDYYSKLLLLRSGEISLEQYVNNYNKVLYEYYTSDVINEPNQRILKDFWKSYDIEKLPYRRGHILAHKWNAEIKKETQDKHSLDQVMLDLFNEAMKEQTKISTEVFIRLSSTYYKGGFKSDLEKHIDKGETITPGENDLGPCVKRKSFSFSKFEHGFDSESTYKDMILKKVNPKSNAYKAGLRDGQKIIARSIMHPPLAASTITIEDKDLKPKVITYWPIGVKKYPGFFYELDTEKYKNNPNECLAWFQN